MSATARRTNVLEALTSLVGRADALLELERRFEEGRRSLTLLGPPGAGKSRLALALAAELSPARYPGGIWHCDLEDCRSADDIRTRVLAVTLGTAAAAPRADEPAVEEVLARQGPSFLLLDNVEAVLPVLAPLLEAWLCATPGLTCLATSRERLGLRAETSFRVGPLADEAAAALFLERCEAARGGRVSADPLLLRAIVRRLDCLPLAIELAAEHARALELGELLTRLEPSLPFLSSTARTGPRRTRCLRAALASSVAALPAVERRAWLALSQYRGDFDLSDAEAAFEAPNVPTAVVLTRLSERSLVWAECVNGATVYRMLRVAREYAAELLAEEPDAEPLRARFRDALLRRVRACVNRETDAGVLAWASRHAESLVACARASLGASALEPALELLVTASHAAALQGPIEPVLSLLDGIALDATEPAVLRCRALHARGRLRARYGEAARALADLRAAHAALPPDGTPRQLRVSVGIDLGNLHRHRAEWALARTYYDEALAACASAEDDGCRARVLAAMAGMAHERGELESSRETFEAALDAARRESLPLVEATIVQNLGLLLLELGDRAAAAACFRRAVEAHRALGHRRFEGIAEYDLASLALEEDAVGEARNGFDRAVALASEVGDRRELGLSLALRAVCHALLQELEPAARDFDAAERVLRALGQPGLVLALEIHREHLALAAALRDLEAGDAEARARKLASVRATLERARSASGTPVPATARPAAHGTASSGATFVSGDEARFAVRVLKTAYGRHVALDDYALVDSGGRWFRPAGGQRVDLSHRVPLQRLLAALVERRLHAPNEPVPADELIRAGWPSDKAVTKAAKNRLHVAIATLRKSGLDPHLVHSAGGYHLARTMPWRAARPE